MVEARIKAIIFDLDDTLHNVEFLMNTALKQGIQAMINKGFNCQIDDGLEKIKEIIKNNPSGDKFSELAKSFNQDNQELIEAGKAKYYDYDFDKMDIFPDSKEVLNRLHEDYKLVLISQGNEDLQNKKIDCLGIRKYFDHIYLPKIGQKEDVIKESLKILELSPEEILIVGDRIDSEIKIGNDLGMQTCRILRGKYKNLEPRFQDEESDYTINTLRGLYGILNLKNDKLR